MLQLAIQGAFRRLDRERLDRAWLAYHAGLFSQPMSEYPGWDDIAAKISGKPKPPMTSAEIAHRMRQWGVAAQMAEAAESARRARA